MHSAPNCYLVATMPWLTFGPNFFVSHVISSLFGQEILGLRLKM